MKPWSFTCYINCSISMLVARFTWFLCFPRTGFGVIIMCRSTVASPMHHCVCSWTLCMQLSLPGQWFWQTADRILQNLCNRNAPTSLKMWFRTFVLANHYSTTTTPKLGSWVCCKDSTISCISTNHIQWPKPQLCKQFVSFTHRQSYSVLQVGCLSEKLNSDN